MRIDLQSLIKPLSVAFLLLLWFALDLLKINDPKLQYTCVSLIGLVVGWHGITNWPLSLTGAPPAAATLVEGLTAQFAPSPSTIVNVHAAAQPDAPATTSVAVTASAPPAQAPIAAQPSAGTLQ
ncbi:hypothetical protein LMG24238_06878 [Paraburkholderia sediminicola]|uniref:Uncharacterized protein n=1 Tax=Paraburkholderia sediminicola TaxID=458836 RepID=A0A6J5CS10_9BURK|nr:hypothetical protein [Paraburkholderia sediminicola]CAB3742404.1 hypothetical protein LMG24238_06878 [Paraburkholderia sediminicola]